MKTKNYILSIVAVIVVVIAIFFFTRWNNERQDRIQMENLLSTTINQYETIISDQGQEINVQTQIIATLENAIAAGLVREGELKEKNIKRLDHIVRLENQITMFEIEIALPDSNLVVVIDTITVMPPGAYLKVPSGFFYSTAWLKLDGTITSIIVDDHYGGPQILIRELQIKTKPSIFIGYQKTGLFKPLRAVVTVEDANPYVHTIKMHNVKIQNKPPFYKRPWFHRFEGIALVIAGQILLNKIQ